MFEYLEIINTGYRVKAETVW